jgi:hypothetical protein
MDEGYILSNNLRRAIFDEFIPWETNINRISEKHHIIKNVTIRIIDDFTKAKVSEKKLTNIFLPMKEKK